MAADQAYSLAKDHAIIIVDCLQKYGALGKDGIMLMSKLDNKFLYLFMDSDVYQICSWEDINYMNPLVQEIVSSAVAQQKAGTVSERVA
jgi:hypothetical protein